MTSSILIIGNPGAGSFSQKKITTAIRVFRQEETDVELYLTQKKGDAENRAIQAVKEEHTLIVAAGGDGTINDVANGLAGSDLAMGILPMGSTNVLSKEIGISSSLTTAVAQVLSGKNHLLPLGRVQLLEEETSRYFLLMADIGYGGKTVCELNPNLKSISSKTAFVVSGMKNLITNNIEKLFFKIDGLSYSGYHVIISKVSRYGGNFRVSPDASVENPELSVCIFKGSKRSDLARYIYGVMTGQHHHFDDVICRQCREIIVEGNAHIQIDGNYFGETPVKIDAIQNAFSLVY